MTEETITNKKIYSEERETCLYGDATYSWSQLQRGNFYVTDAFVAGVCNLPDEYDEAKYREFVNLYGTHVVIKSHLGTKTIKVFEATTAEFTEFALQQNKASVSVEGGYGPVSASLSVDFDKLKKSTKAGCEFGSKETEFTIGTEERPEPIKIELKPLTDLFVKEMYKEESLERANCVLEEATLETRKGHLLTFFSDYPQLLHVVLPANQTVTLDLNWPKGTYGLPMPDGGCPAGKDFTWHEGKFLQDNEDDENWQKGSPGNHLGIGLGRTLKNSQQRFCVKTQVTPDNLIWPRGSYCINKKGDCPNGFTAGKVTWNDQKYYINNNRKSGALPDGDQWKGDNPGTRVEYCCRTDDYPENEIFLPFDKPFLLYMAPNNHECQRVFKMDVQAEWFSWNTEDDSSVNKIEGTVPKGNYGENVKQFYCYYTPQP